MSQMKLAEIKRIGAIGPIENSDNLEVAQIGGWYCVVRKGDYVSDQLCVYIPIDVEIDANHAIFVEIFRGKTGWQRIKTQTIRGQISQGLILPISVLPTDREYNENDCVQELLPIRKYEKPGSVVQASNPHYKPFPDKYIDKTDETNLQSRTSVLAELAGRECYMSIKVDGTSATFIYNGTQFMVCSRNQQMDDRDTPYWNIVQRYDLENTMIRYGRHLAIQGEIAGPKINGNIAQLPERELYVFNIKDLTDGRYLSLPEMLEVCSVLGVRSVPIIRQFIFDDTYMSPTIDTLLEIANAQTYESIGSPTIAAEGIVVRPVIPHHSRILGRMLSVKILNQHYKDN